MTVLFGESRKNGVWKSKNLYNEQQNVKLIYKQHFRFSFIIIHVPMDLYNVEIFMKYFLLHVNLCDFFLKKFSK